VELLAVEVEYSALRSDQVPGSARAPKCLGIDLVGSERENSGVAARLDDLASQVLDGVVHHLADTKAAGRHRGLGAQADVSHCEVLGLVRPRRTRRQRQQKEQTRSNSSYL